jgi:hypothetical protein
VSGSVVVPVRLSEDLIAHVKARAPADPTRYPFDEARVREIEDELTADARDFPAFSAARQAAVLACFRESPGWACMIDVAHYCGMLRRYEEKRGPLRDPAAVALAASGFAKGMPSNEAAVVAYERASAGERAAA